MSNSARTITAGLFAVCLWVISAFAQVDEFKQFEGVIKSIGVEFVGPKAVTENYVRTHIRLKPGDRYFLGRENEDLKRLLGTDEFYNIIVITQKVGQELNVVFKIQCNPRVVAIDVVLDGKEPGKELKLKKAKLLKAIQSREGEKFLDRKVAADIRILRDEYFKSGYHQVKVQKQPGGINAEQGTIALTYLVDEGEKVKIERIEFPATKAFSEKQLKGVVKTRERRRWYNPLTWFTGDGRLMEDTLQEDLERIQAHYQEKGYLDASATAQPVKDAKNKVFLKFIVNEGRQYRVGDVTFEFVKDGKKADATHTPVFSETNLLAKLKLTSGKIFQPGNLDRSNKQSDIEILKSLYGARAYVDVRIDVEQHANVKTGAIDLLYRIDERDPVDVELVRIQGNDKTKDIVIRRELAITEGEPFDLGRVELSKRRLEGTRLFQSVHAFPETIDLERRKNLVISVKEADTGQMGFGGGFSTDYGALVHVFFSQENFDLFRWRSPNALQGAGQKFRMRSAIGFSRTDHSMDFEEPWFLGRKLKFDASLFHRENEYYSDQFDIVETGMRLGLEKTLFGNDFIRGGINYSIENVGMVNFESGTSAEMLTESGHTLISKFGANLSYDTRGGGFPPNRGQKTILSAGIAGGPVGGEADFYNIDLYSAWYFKGLGKGHIIELIGHGAVTDPYGDSSKVPYYHRLFLGGSSSLRGFKYREVGPRDSSDAPIGGNTLVAGTFEYSVPTPFEIIRFAAFYDVGLVRRDAYDFGFSDYNDNWGIGMRMDIPRLGPLRIDIGFPIRDDGKNGGTSRFNFSFGYTTAF
ncbi:MAG: outer membrane protein assembly factor BamA [Pedosphaera sp.]|nr:outer membrane protein assembly factor BamA [Pedosphaera sp.]